MSLFSARNLLFAGAGLYVATAFGTYCIVRRSGPTSCGGHAHGFDGLAETYDQLVGMDELFMGMNWLRWGLLGEAKGDVLEISAGTGRSLPHYRLTRLRSLTFSDTSSNMLQKAREKVRQRAAWDRGMPTIRFALADAENLAVDATTSEKPPQPVKAQANRVTAQPSGELDVDAELLQRAAAAAAGAAAKAVPKSFAPRSFDTVVDAFGLCSHDDPVQALRQASLMCKEDGVILLLEHGRSTWSLLNQQLDRSAQQHYDTWSCWWNRDILDIVKQAHSDGSIPSQQASKQEAGLHVVSCSRWHFGTTYCIVAKPVPAPQPGTSSGS